MEIYFKTLKSIQFYQHENIPQEFIPSVVLSVSGILLPLFSCLFFSRRAFYPFLFLHLKDIRNSPVSQKLTIASKQPGIRISPPSPSLSLPTYFPSTLYSVSLLAASSNTCLSLLLGLSFSLPLCRAWRRRRHTGSPWMSASAPREPEQSQLALFSRNTRACFLRRAYAYMRWKVYSASLLVG